MDPLSIACVTAAVNIGGAMVVNKGLSYLYDKLKDILGNFFYREIIVTLAQNPEKAINLLRFISNVPGDHQHKRCVSLNIGINNSECLIPLTNVDLVFTCKKEHDETMHKCDMKVNADAYGVVYNIVVSTWKRETLSLSLDSNHVATFDRFYLHIPCSTQLQEQCVQLSQQPIQQPIQQQTIQQQTIQIQQIQQESSPEPTLQSLQSMFVCEQESSTRTPGSKQLLDFYAQRQCRDQEQKLKKEREEKQKKAKAFYKSVVAFNKKRGQILPPDYK